ncbi:MAG: diguanylate cyclase [Phycisphaeraceae bacterium]|nr:diguanylate cyclase [Phycisphaeraceae bacterium]
MRTEAVHPVEGEQRVLVIDDSKDVHRLLQARLRNEELTLLSAYSGPESLEVATQQRPDVILLDLDMPGMDGFEVMRRLKENAATIHIPIIILSGQQSRQDKVTAFDLGAVDYITKPFDLVELRVRVRSAVRTSMLVQMLAQRAQIDGLTGLYNRAHFDARWSEEVAGCTRHNRPLSLALLDADRFKSINDTYGHPAGDAVLRGIARVLRRECRESDIACRFGGEEFALIMPDTALSSAEVVCERIRATLETLSWPLHPERFVTISIGLAGADGATAASAEAWLEMADRSLYGAKNAGRNRVLVTTVPSRGPRLAQAG